MTTRPTKTANIEANPCGGISKHSFRLRAWDVVQVHRLWVPDKSDNVTVLSLQRGEASNGTNLLLMPVKLLYLNNVLQWFRWADTERTDGFVIGLDQPGPLMMSVTKEAPIDWVGQHADEARASWFKENPGGTTDQWFAYLASRINEGRACCGMNQCFERAATGSAWCAEHTDHMNKLYNVSSNPK